MPTLNQRLRELDRRVLREDRLATPEGWRREMSRWWLWVAAAGVAGAVALVGDLMDGDVLAVYVLMAGMWAFRAGQQKAEHDRLTGRDRLLGRRRPPGV